MTHTRRSLILFFLLIFLTGYMFECNMSVWQTPRNITAVCGDRVDITCHFTPCINSTSQKEGWKVNWRRENDTEISNKTYNKLDFNSDYVSDVNKSHTLTLNAVSETHGGVYYCTVVQDMPTLCRGNDSTGTRLTVECSVTNTTVCPPTGSREVSGTLTTLLVLALVSALTLMIVTTAVCCKYRGFCKRGKKEGQAEQEDAGVVYSTVKLHKRPGEKTTQELGEAPDPEFEENPEVLYSDIHIKL